MKSHHAMAMAMAPATANTVSGDFNDDSAVQQFLQQVEGEAGEKK